MEFKKISPKFIFLNDIISDYTDATVSEIDEIIANNASKTNI